jgi:hydrogenase maturation protease
VVDALSHRTDRVTTITREGDLAVLPLLWEPEDDVVIVDASYSGSEPVGQIQEIDPDELSASLGMSTHGVNVADAIELARRLGRSPARLRIVGISAHEFHPGQMSRRLHRRVDALAAELLSLLELECDEANIEAASGGA